MTHRLDRLDHLRAIAAFLVVAWHFGNIWPYQIASGFEFLSIAKQGHAGVSFFCVISGFILTTIYARRETPYSAFVRNRVLRIAPLFIFVVFLTFYATGWEALSLITTITTGLVRGGLPSFAGPGWTVLVEFQFYLIFPFLLIFCGRYGLKYLIGLLATFILARAAVWNSTDSVQLVSYYSVFGRMDQFLIGMIAAKLFINPRIESALSDKRMAIGIFGAGLIATVAFFWWFNSNGGLLAFQGEAWPSKSPVWIIVPTIESVVFGAILVGYLHLPGLAQLNWLSRALAYVGRVSYSIYLDHVLVIAGVVKLMAWLRISPTSWEMTLVVCVLLVMPCLVAAASLTYFLIEKPFMDLRDRTRTTGGATS